MTQQTNGRKASVEALKNDDPLLETRRNSVFGRYCVAREPIQAGTILFEEEPFVVGPKPNTPPICLECCGAVDGSINGPRCPECNWPLCRDCQLDANKKYHLLECQLFVANKVRFQDFSSQTEPCLQLDCITPLRFLLTMEKQPERWLNEIVPMEYHAEARKDTPLWKMDQINIVGYLRGPCKLKERFSEELIQQICGLLEVNVFEGKTKNGHRVRCIYPRTSILTHSCVSNTIHSILPSKNFKIVMRAAVIVPKGDILCANYTYLLSGTQTRQEHLRQGKYFTCQCKRCSDPTELGTNFSSIVCQKCGDGMILPVNPIGAGSSDWNCVKCGFKTTSEAVSSIVSSIETEVNALQNAEDTPEIIDICEQRLKKYEKMLHPNHFLTISLKECLIEKYGSMLSNQGEEFNLQHMDRKIQLCYDVLRVLDVLQPGLNRTRAMLLYEIYIAKMTLIKKNWDTLSDRDVELATATKLLQECLTVFEWEDDSSLEQYLARMCKQINADFVASSM